MANQKITQLTAASGANLTDLLVKVNDPSGSPTNQKLTIQQLATLFNISFPSSTLQITGPDGDQVLQLTNNEILVNGASFVPTVDGAQVGVWGLTVGEDGISCNSNIDCTSFNCDGWAIDASGHFVVADNSGASTAGPLQGFTGSFTVALSPSGSKVLTFDRGVLITAV